MSTAATSSAPAAARLSWPAARFYFTLLDTSRLPKGERITDERLRYLLEPELPEPLEEVHAVFRRIGDSKWIACAVSRRTLESEIAPAVVSLTPQDLPEVIKAAAAAPIAAADLELLVGEYEPRSVRAWRRRCSYAAGIGLLLVLTIALIGIERRIDQATAVAAELRARRASKIDAALGAASAASPLPPELRLLAELRALRQTRRQGDTVPPTRDATDVLEALLARWPEALPTRTDAIVVSDSAVHVRGTVAESDAAQALAYATTTLNDFKAAFPAVQSAPGGWRFGLEWRRDPSATEGRQ